MKSIIVTAITALWVLGSVVANAENTDNRVSVLSSGYVQPIQGRGFMPGAQTDGSRKVASTISLVQGEGIVLIADPGMAAPGVWDRILTQLQSIGRTILTTMNWHPALKSSVRRATRMRMRACSSKRWKGLTH